MSDELELVVIDRAPDGASAEMLAGLLESNGIPAHVAGQSLVDGWALSQRAMVGVEIRVPRARAEEARRLLRELQPGSRAGSSDDPPPGKATRPAAPPAEPELPAGERRLLGFELLAVFLVAILPSIYSSVRWLLAPGAPLTPAESIEATLYGDLPPTALLLYLMARSGRGWAHYGLVRPRWLRDPAIALGALLILVPLTVTLPVAGSGAVDPHPPVRFALEAPAIALIGMVCLNVFFQELLMRGYLLPRLREWLGSTPLSLMLGAAGFALWHLHQGPAGVLGSFVAGVVLGGVFWTTRRLWPVVIAHAIVNLFLAGPVRP